MSEQLDKLILALDGARASNRNKTVWMAKCPAHEDKTPSLRITETNGGRLLIHCFAGCGALDVLDSVGLSWGDLYPDDKNYKSLSRRVTDQEEYDRHLIFIAEDHIAQGIRLSENDKHAYHAAKLRGMR